MPSSSFSTKRLNSTTFVITEDDKYREHPLIYAKVHPKAPIIVLSDTGCDEPSEKRRNGESKTSLICERENGFHGAQLHMYSFKDAVCAGLRVDKSITEKWVMALQHNASRNVI